MVHARQPSPRRIRRRTRGRGLIIGSAVIAAGIVAAAIAGVSKGETNTETVGPVLERPAEEPRPRFRMEEMERETRPLVEKERHPLLAAVEKTFPGLDYSKIKEVWSNKRGRSDGYQQSIKRGSVLVFNFTPKKVGQRKFPTKELFFISAGDGKILFMNEKGKIRWGEMRNVYSNYRGKGEFNATKVLNPARKS